MVLLQEPFVCLSVYEASCIGVSAYSSHYFLHKMAVESCFWISQSPYPLLSVQDFFADSLIHYQLSAIRRLSSAKPSNLSLTSDVSMQ